MLYVKENISSKILRAEMFSIKDFHAEITQRKTTFNLTLKIWLVWYSWNYEDLIILDFMVAIWKISDIHKILKALILQKSTLNWPSFHKPSPRFSKFLCIWDKPVISSQNHRDCSKNIKNFNQITSNIGTIRVSKTIHLAMNCCLTFQT